MIHTIVTILSLQKTSILLILVSIDRMGWSVMNSFKINIFHIDTMSCIYLITTISDFIVIFYLLLSLFFQVIPWCITIMLRLFVEWYPLLINEETFENKWGEWAGVPVPFCTNM